MDLYAENILDHYRHPRGKSPLRSATITHEEVNPSCGDVLTVELLLRKDDIQKIGWGGAGCAISQAGMSLLWEFVHGKSTGDIEALTSRDVLVLLGVPIGPRRTKCALLCLHALQNALRKAKELPKQSWRETVGT